MKFTIERDAMLDALATVSRVALKSDAIPIYRHLLMEVRAGMVELTANDLTVSISASVSASTQSNGARAVPADMLHRLVKSLPKGAHLDLSADTHNLSLRHGKSAYSLPTLPAEDFPARRTIENAVGAELGADEIGDLFARGLSTVENGKTRYYLAGIYLHAIEGRLAACSTNGIGLTLVRTTARAPSGMASVIVSTETAQLIASIAEKGAKVEWSRAAIAVTVDGVRLVSSVIDGTFPDYQRVVPAPADTGISVDKDALAGATERLSLLRDTDPVIEFSWEVEPTELVLSLRGEGAGTELLECEGAGMPPGVMGMRCKGLVPDLAALRGPVVRISALNMDPSIGEVFSAVRFEDPSDPNILLVEMPYKTRRATAKAA